MDLINKTLGSRYEILEQIGTGGMAEVYRAKCKLLNRFVAVKVLKNEFSKDAEFVKRFRAEAQSAASLTHPNIVSVYDVGEEDGINYIVMELLNGNTLKDEIEKKGKLGSEMTLKYASQIASALEAAHASKIIHRDIKPQNIVLTSNNVAKVTDFGIARMSSKETITSSTNTIGSVHYFSPEHAKGCYTDEKSDIYSLGVVMYEMATGKLPFNADTPVSVALKQIQEVPVSPIELEPTVTPELNRIILKAMAKSTTDRYQTATEMLDDIFAAINSPTNMLYKERARVEQKSFETRAVPIIGIKDDVKPSIGDIDKDEYLSSRKSKRLGFREISKDDNKNIEAESLKKKKIIKISIITGAAILVIVFGILIGSIIKSVSSKNKSANKIETAPDLLNKNFEEVRVYYEPLGLTISLNRYENSSEVEEGNIISQDVEKGQKLNTNDISVIVSKGSKKVKMIDVVGKDYTVAKYELNSLGIVPEFEFKVDEKIAENIIISQDVEKDKEIAVNSKVKIIVSKGNGKNTAIVPNLVGSTYSVAKNTIEKLKLAVGTISYKTDTSKVDSAVLSQSVKENSELEEGQKIDLVINRLQKSKNVTIDMVNYMKESAATSANVRVTAEVEGVTNTIYTGVKNSPYENFSVTVNGFSKATVKIYIDSNLIDTKEITF